MAKGSAMGIWRGKKGSSVFYKLSNSNSAQKQGIRERAYEVKNPQTMSQASQRLKMLPASRVYGALKEVIERAWQGIPYGGRCRQAYMKRALRAENNIPYMDKGTDILLPGAYQVSKGTIQPLQYYYDARRRAWAVAAYVDIEDGSWGDASWAILDALPSLKDGDKITFLLFLLTYEGNTRTARTTITLDTTSEEAMTEYLDAHSVTSEEGETGWAAQLQITDKTLNVQGADVTITGFAAIVSRNGTAPLRSSQSIALNVEGTAIERYYTPAAHQAARRSYARRG